MQAETLFKDTQLQASALTSKKHFLCISWNICHVANTTKADSSILGCQLSKYQPIRRNIPEDLKCQERCEYHKSPIRQINHVCHNQTHTQHSVLVNGTECLFHRSNGYSSLLA